MNIDKYDVLRYAETLSEEDLQLLLEQLILIQNVKYPIVYNNGFISKVPETEKHTSKKSIEDRMKDFKDYLEKDMRKLKQNSFIDMPTYNPRPLKDVSGVEQKPPKMVWRNCVCGFWRVVHGSACTCGGGRFVPEGEL